MSSRKKYWGRAAVVERSRQENQALAVAEKAPPSPAALALLEKAALRKQHGPNVTKAKHKQRAK